MDKTFDLYRDIAERTDGDVYIGVVGPVRTGKSTLIARMMEKLVLPAMAPGPRRDRLSDELPQCYVLADGGLVDAVYLSELSSAAMRRRAQKMVE